jgi:sugar lactone lactonase YvrE
MRVWWLLAPLAMLGTAAWWWWPDEAPPVLQPGWIPVVSVIGDDTFVEPFGVTTAADGTIYVTDGAGGNRIRAVSPDGRVRTLAGAVEGRADGSAARAQFHAPSGLALDRAGTIYVADTGNNAVRRVTPDGQVSTLASELNGPVGVAVDAFDRVVVSDTYNDRLVRIDAEGRVHPLPLDVVLDTPTGIAIDPGGTVYVADTGNDVIRAIAADGLVTTLDAAAIGGLRRPIGVAVDSAGMVYVTDESARVIELRVDAPGEARVVAGSVPGFHNGLGHDALFRQPAGIAVVTPGRLIVADAGNALVRSVTATVLAEAKPPPSPWLAPGFAVDDFMSHPLLWPLDPLGGPFEIAGTLGEARGEDAARFHAGIDVRAEQGAAVLAVRDGIVRAPLSTGDFGSLNEWMRIGDLSYVHLRAGRTSGGELVDTARFVATRDDKSRVVRMRVKRGARFSIGEAVGSVNAFNHVHLNVGWGGEEYNPLLFRLVQFEDTVAPTIARGGIRLYDAGGGLLIKREKGRILVSGPVTVVVDAWDQANGNRPNRRLGVYSLGYQILRSDGTPMPGYEQPLETIRFDRLSPHPEATRLVYASGSGIPFYGQRRTRFLYIVTNRFRDGNAEEGVWDSSQLPSGDYTLRVRVADIHGNEATRHRDLPVRVTGRDHTTGG